MRALKGIVGQRVSKNCCFGLQVPFKAPRKSFENGDKDGERGGLSDMEPGW